MLTGLPSIGYKNLSASANVSPNPVSIQGFFVNSFTSGAVIQFYTDPSPGTGTAITGPITILTATPPNAPGWYPLPVSTAKGLYVTITTQAANITIC